jgi:WD40 repeat protein
VRRSDLLRIVVILLALLRALALGAEYPPDKAFLRIETGQHNALISRMDVDASGRYLVTASLDKTGRVWDLRDGKQLTILRPPQGDGVTGALYAVAISPDGRTVALGGLTAPSGSTGVPIYIFDRARGALRQRILASEAVRHLAYSKKGDYLVAALGGTHGIRIFETGKYQEVARDAPYSGDTFWAEFDDTGRLVTASFGRFLGSVLGSVRVYNPVADIVRRGVITPFAYSSILGGKEPFSARFSPDGERIAVGFHDSTVITIVSSRTLQPIFQTGMPNGKSDLSFVAWSPDGQAICAAGTYRNSNGLHPILCGPSAGRGKPKVYEVATDTIMGLGFLADGRLAFASAAPEIGLLDRDGSVLWKSLPQMVDLKIEVDDLRLSTDGRTAEFPFFAYNDGLWTRQIVRFTPEEWPRFALVSQFSLPPPRTTGIPIQNWNSAYRPTLNGRALQVDADNEMCRSLAISQTADRFVLGCEWSIEKFTRTGERLLPIPVPGPAWGVNLTSDSRYVVAVLGDGTVRWYNINTNREILAFFLHRDGKTWIAWTPEGFFDASPRGDALIGYHVNRGPDHEGEFVRFNQLLQDFYRPDLISERLKPGGDDRIAAAQRKVGDINVILNGGPPPEVKILSLTDSHSNGEFTLEFQVSDRGGGIGDVVIQVGDDGAPVEWRAASGIPGESATRKITLNLAPGERTVWLSAKNRANKLPSQPDSRTATVVAPPGRSKLYVVSVGVSHYRDSDLNKGVQFAADDARQVANKLQRYGNKVFTGGVIPYSLIDPTLQAIEARIGAVAREMDPNDAFVLYLAGHGASTDGKYSFVASDQQSLGEERLEALLRGIKGNKILLLVDTCSAGALVRRDPALDAIERLARITGRSIIAGAASDKVALEGYNKHGVLTASLLEALEKERDREGRLRLGLLADYVYRRVPEITSQMWHVDQRPQVSLNGEPFELAHELP